MNASPSRLILCGTDFSENAAQAGAAAAALARHWKKPLVLLHAADEFNANAETPDELAAFLQPARQRLEEERTRLAASGAEVAAEVLHGKVAEQAILGFAGEHPADLIVVSAVSKTAFDRWTLGSVSERIAEAAPAATLIVRASAPFEAWVRGERALKVFVGADFSASAEAALRWVGGLRKLGPCEVTAAYVDFPAAEHERLGIQGPPGVTENHPDLQRVLERDFRERVTAALGDAPVEICVRAGSGRVDVHLVNLARAAQADLLVVGTHQRHGLDRWTQASVSRGVLRHAPMSVACVPAAALPARSPAISPCRRVLAATDLTPDGGLALPYAYSVVNAGGTVCLVHVAKPFGEHEGARSSADLAAQLRSLIPPEAHERGIRTEVTILDDRDTSRAICQAAESLNADLVCIGGNTRPGFSARVMGSVTLAILQHCRRPVLVVWPRVA
jgi:nucleotide-binding universal stress UspA family protein